MNKLYTKSEILFSIMWIVIYIVGTIILDNISALLHITNFFTPVFYILITLALLVWIFKNQLNSKYGLCKSPFRLKYFLFFIPLVVLVSINFWFGVKLDTGIFESVVFIINMLCVGFLEEIIFRGFLFKAMEKDGLKVAILVSSLTFGFGHIINLFVADANLILTLLQICYATTTGLLFVIIFYRGKTLLPCIITHSVFNALSLFSASTSITLSIVTAVIMMVLTLLYALVLIKVLPKENSEPINNKSSVLNK